MIEIRPIWLMPSAPPDIHEGPISALLTQEKLVIEVIRACYELTQYLLDDDAVSGVRFLEQSANADLTAGCELARSGYLKQAYSLWRSWFEQSLFALYFLEAPIHRLAWKVSDEVGLDDNPQYRLMLHQLINDSGERHPFGLVYNDRHHKLLETLKITSSPKTERPVHRAARVLTLLSQGVHGTYQPTRAGSTEACLLQIQQHCLPTLQSAIQSLLHFWVLFLADLYALPPEFVISMREGNATMDHPSIKGLDLPDTVLDLTSLLQQIFPVKQNG